jgi:hypothetical protein
MSTARRFALVVTFASALAALYAAAAHAQASPTNPSGGTSLRQTTLEGSGSSGAAGVLSRDLSVQIGWKSWLGTFAASRYGFAVVGRTWDWPSLSAVVRRTAARR